MKPVLTVLIIGLVMGLLFVFGGRRIDLLVVALGLFAIGMVAWTISQYDHHHFG